MPKVPRGRPRKRPVSVAQGEADNLDDDDDDSSSPPPKRPRKQKPYVPVYRSGPYALLLALYEEQLARGGSPVGGIMTRQQLIDVAQKYCDSSFIAPSDTGKFYTAWAGMRILTQKDLVWERGNPKKYSLSDAGEEVARGIMRVQRMREGGSMGEDGDVVEGEREVVIMPPRKTTRKENGRGEGKAKEKGKGKEDVGVIAAATAPTKRKVKATITPSAVATLTAESSIIRAAATNPSSSFKEFDTPIVLDDDQCLELFDNPVNSRPQLPKPSPSFPGANWLGDFDIDMTGTATSKASTTHPCVGKTTTLATTTRLNDETDRELQRRLRLEAIERRLSGLPPSSGAAPPSSPPLPSAQPPRPLPPLPAVRNESIAPVTSSKSNFFDLTLDSPPPSPLPPRWVRSELPISPSRPLASRNLNLGINQPSLPLGGGNKLPAAPAASAAREPLARSTSQQQPPPWARQPSTKPASAVVVPGSTSLLSKPTTPLAAISEPTITSRASGSNTSAPAFPTFTPTPWTPGTFNIHLILDSREVRSKSDRTYLQTELSTRDVTPITRPLHLGDALWIARHNTSGKELVLDYVIERKRMDDLVGSIKDGRFHEQKWRLRRSGVKNIIYLIEDVGNWVPGGSNGSGMDDGGAYMREAVNTAISSTQVVNGFFLKRTCKVDDSIRYLARMHNFLSKVYAKQTLYPIPSHLLSSKTYTTELQPHLAQAYPGKDFFPEYDAWNELVDKSGQLTQRDVFLKMLMCIRGLSVEKAIEIQRVWKTPSELLGAFEGCKTAEERWEMVMKGVGGRGVGRKRIGKALSRKVCEVWWGAG